MEILQTRNLVPTQRVFLSTKSIINLEILLSGLIDNCPDVIIYFDNEKVYQSALKIVKLNLAEKHLKLVSSNVAFKTLNNKLIFDNETDIDCNIDLAIIDIYPPIEVIETNFEQYRTSINVRHYSLLIFAAQNFARTMVMTGIYYKTVIPTIKSSKGCTTFQQRFDAAQKAFGCISKVFNNVSDNFQREVELNKNYQIY